MGDFNLLGASLLIVVGVLLFCEGPGLAAEAAGLTSFLGFSTVGVNIGPATDLEGWVFRADFIGDAVGAAEGVEGVVGVAAADLVAVGVELVEGSDLGRA